MSIQAVGSTPCLIDTTHIAYIRPCRWVSAMSNTGQDFARYFGIGFAGRELLFKADAPGIDQLLRSWYGPEWEKMVHAIDWTKAANIGGMPTEP